MDNSVTELVRVFFEHGRDRLFEKGESMYFAGDSVDYVYFIVSGRIGQYNISKNGQKTVLNVFKEGAFIPLPYVVRSMPTPHFFEALSPCVTKVRSAADIRDFMQQNSQVAMEILRRVYDGVDGMYQRMLLMASGDAKTRVALELTIVAKRFGETDASGNIVLPVTETELATTAGLSRETVSREIGKLKKQSIVATEQNRLIVKDLDALHAIVAES